MSLRVLLFDPNLGGHHLGYASLIGRYLERNGDSVIFLTWAPNPHLEKLSREVGSIEIRTVKRESTSPFHGNRAQQLARGHIGLRRTFDLATSLDVDIVHLLYLDRSEIPLLSSLSFQRPKPRWRLFATLWWPYLFRSPSDSVSYPKRVYHFLNRAALRKMLRGGTLDGLFVHAEGIKDLAVAQCGGNRIRERVRVIPDPSEPPQITLTRDKARRHLRLPRRGPIILFFGGLRYDKGPDILLDALTHLEGNWIAVFAGEADMLGPQELEAVKQTHQKGHRLFCRVGFVSDQDRDSYFAAADIVVLPYRKVFLGTSGVLQRAAAAGKPVIATDVGEVGKTVREQGLGLVAEPESSQALADALEEFLEHQSEFARRVRPRALEYAKRSDWRELGRLLREAYLG
jgi:glycosyltransferase involved in cell wall biosynthesis